MKLIYIFLLCFISSCLCVTDLAVTANITQEEKDKILAYSNSAGFAASDEGTSENLSSLWVSLPSPFNTIFPSPENPRLPTSPNQTIYRFQFIDIEKPAGITRSPFSYVEIDWNTEGLPRGPNNSFVTPHFDFHFYIPSRDFIRSEVSCPQLVGPSIGRTCDALQTDYTKLKKFLNVPPQEIMPNNYFTDSGSSITVMGLHNLDKLMDYSTENVNVSPVIIYGSFDGDVIFLEFSITAYVFQNAINNGEQAWPIRLPNGVNTSRWWPQTFAVQYNSDTDSFLVSLRDMNHLMSMRYLEAAQPISRAYTTGVSVCFAVLALLSLSL